MAVWGETLPPVDLSAQDEKTYRKYIMSASEITLQPLGDIKIWRG